MFEKTASSPQPSPAEEERGWVVAHCNDVTVAAHWSARWWRRKHADLEVGAPG
jgi:hypothetical protein